MGVCQTPKPWRKPQPAGLQAVTSTKSTFSSTRKIIQLQNVTRTTRSASARKSQEKAMKHEKCTTANKTITPDNKPDEQLEMGTTDNKTTTAHTKTNEKDDKGSFDNNGCCSKVFIDFVKDDPYRPSYKDPKTSKLYESFFVKEDDGKNVYKSETSSNKYAMWWKNGFWMVGHYENKNSYTALAFAKSYNYCPEKINYDWEYFSSLDGTFRRAEGGLSVYHKCKSDDD